MLAESSSRRVEYLSEFERRRIDMAGSTARDLARLSGGRLTVMPEAEPGQWAVTAQQWVGTVVLPGLEIVVRPKVPLENVFLMLGVGLPATAWRPETFGFATSRNLLPAFAAFFARTLERALANGLVRSYRQERELLPTVRGRIDIKSQFRRPGLEFPAPCEFDEFTADTQENRLLKAAVRRSLRLIGVDPGTRRTLARELTRFEEVTDVIPDTMPGAFVYTRLNAHYEPAVRLATLILKNTTLLDRAGSADASAFLVDMNDLFQRFLTHHLTASLRGRLVVRSEPRAHLGHGKRVTMWPDLVFEHAGRPVYVADAKYKLLDGGMGRNADYYQMLAYTTAMELAEGLLIYCTTEGDPPPTTVRVRNTGVSLCTYALDLSGSWEQIEASVSGLCNWIVSRTGAVVGRQQPRVA